MDSSSVLVLGSPIKDHLATSMPGPAGAGAAAASGPTVASGVPAAGMLTAGQSSATATHLAAGATVAKTAAVGSIFGSLFYTAAVVAVGYVGYRAAKALWEAAAKRPLRLHA